MKTKKIIYLSLFLILLFIVWQLITFEIVSVKKELIAKFPLNYENKWIEIEYCTSTAISAPGIVILQKRKTENSLYSKTIKSKDYFTKIELIERINDSVKIVLSSDFFSEQEYDTTYINIHN